jgi:hypothetical protein
MLLVLDEANQVVEHITEGNTLGSRWADILERFALATRHAIATGAIALAEDGIPDRAVTFHQNVSDADTVVSSHTRSRVSPWQCTVYRGQASGFRARFLQAVGNGQPLLFVTASQLEAKRMERAIAKAVPGKKVVRIDSETNQADSSPLSLRVLIPGFRQTATMCSSSVPALNQACPFREVQRSRHAYFKAVWGYFPGSLLTSCTALGALPPTRSPHVVFCPDFALSSGDESC